MTELSKHSLTDFFSSWLFLPLVTFAVGYIAGMVHFRSLEAIVHRLVAGELTAVFLQIGRLAALGVVLWLFALLGAPELIAGACGVLFARARVIALFRTTP